MSERTSAPSRLRIIWILLAGFLVTGIGASLIAILLVDPDSDASGIGQWVLLGVLILAAAAALAVLHGRWFARQPNDVGMAISVGVVVRLAVVEILWLATFAFYVLGLVTAGPLVASIIAAVALTLLFAAPTARLTTALQEQLDSIGTAADVDMELRRPMHG